MTDFIPECTQHPEYNLENLNVDRDSVGVEAYTYEAFRLQRAIRRITNFIAPRFSNLDTFELPRESIVHYLAEGNVELGPAPTDILFRNAPSLILAENVIQLSSNAGSPLRTPLSPDKLQQDYRQQYRRIRPLKNITVGLRDARTILVINYALLNRLFRYRPLPLTRYFKFQNVINTWVDKVNYLASQTTRQQWIKLKLPEKIPNKSEFIRGSLIINRQTLQFFTDDNSLLLLELWKWLGPNRETSVLNKLTPEAIERLNFLVVEQGKYTFFNLSMLNESRVDPSAGILSGQAPQQMQLNFIKFMDSVFTIRSVAAKTTIETLTEEEDINTVLLEAGKVDNDDDIKVVDEKVVSVDRNPVMTDDTDTEPTVISINNDGEELELLSQLESEAQAALVAGEFTDIQTQFIPTTEPDSTVEPPEDENPTTIVTGVVEAAQRLQRDALISYNEYSRYERLAKSYQTIPNPFGDGTLEDLAKPDPTITGTLEPGIIPDIPTVLDKSMLQSTLINFDPVYIEKVLNKDVAAMLLSAQKAGVAITGFQVTPYVDANNQFDIYEIKFTPVGGAPSTFRFRLPRVNKDGVWVTNNIKYRMRKQHRD
jgi:hypothetical protein